MQPKNLSNGAHLHNMEILSRISINPKCEADLSDLGLLSVHIQKRQIQKCFLMNENHFISTQIMDLRFGHVFELKVE